MTLSGGSAGDLPSTNANVTADSLGNDKFKWDISGLKTGTNQVTFDSKGENTVHTIIAVPVKGQAPPLSQIQQDLAKRGPPPSYVDAERDPEHRDPGRWQLPDNDAGPETARAVRVPLPAPTIVTARASRTTKKACWRSRPSGSGSGGDRRGAVAPSSALSR